jgi:succinoglycan biosynthesis transport protein ExoP
MMSKPTVTQRKDAPAPENLGAHVREWGQSALRDLMALAGRTLASNMHGMEFGIHGTFSMVRRRWPILAVCSGAAVVLMMLLLLVMRPEYTAEALMQINTRQEQVTTFEDVLSGANTTDAAIRTEVDVLQSRKLAARVIKELNLMNNPDFAPQPGVVGTLMALAKSALLPVATPEKTKAVETAEETRAINILLSNLNVQMKPRSFSIMVRYTAYDPKLAADIANAVGQQYLTNQLEERFDATKRANDWMNKRLKELQRNVQAAEMAVRQFRDANNLTEARGMTLSDQQLSELNSQLILARTQLAEAQAKVTSTARGVGNTSEVLNNPLIQNLRIQETEVRRKMSDLASRYGERHPRMQTVRNELADVQRKISEETGKIRGSLDNDIDMAKARVATLEQQLDALKVQNQMSSGSAVQLAELERQAAAERGLYEAFLARSRQIAQMDFVTADARIISAAETPLRPSAPKKSLLMMMAFVLGLGLGIAIMLALELLDSGFRNGSQLEASTGLPVLGLLGELTGVEDVAHYVVNKPTGAFTEAVRAIRTSLQFMNPDKPIKVVMVTSSVPQEGKSLFACSLAQLSAAGGSKVLLVDADMRRPTISHRLSLKPTAGLAEVLVGSAKQKDVIEILKPSGVHVLPALANTQFAQELLASSKMRDLLAEWRKTYDLVVIDCPPVMAVSDAVTVSGLVDATVFMARWGTTPRPLVANALKQLKSAHAPVAGVVMTRVDLEKQQAYGYGDYGYYYGKYKEYYSD